MAEGQVAGRLLVEIEASAAGFARDLRQKVDDAAAGVAAKIGIEIDGDGLRKRLKAAVKQAAAGLTATVKVDVDQDHLKAKLEAAVTDATGKVHAKVKASPDEGHFRQELERVVTEASNGRNSRVRVQSDVDRDTLVGAVRRRIAEAESDVAQGGGVKIPFKLPGRALFMGAIVALVQPAVGALGQLGAGLTAMVGSAAPAVNTLGALPGVLVALGTALLSTKALFGGVGGAVQAYAQKLELARTGSTMSAGEFSKVQGAIAGIAPAARESIQTVLGFGDAWRKIKLDAQQKMFASVAKELGPLGNTLLPQVKEQLNGVANVVGDLLANGARWMQTPIFRADFAAITKSNTRVLGIMSSTLGAVGHAFEDLLVSSGPFVERLAQATYRGAEWARTAIAAGRESGALNKAMNQGADVGASLGRSLRELGKGLGGMFADGRESGNQLLASMEAALTKFDKWAHSDLGQTKMKAFFDQALPGFHELVGLVGDIGKGLGRLASDGGMAAMVSQIRTQLVPAIGALINGVGRDLGPHVISVISNIAEVIGRLASGAAAFAPILAVFSGLGNILATLLRTVPGLSSALGTLLVAMLAIKAIQSINGIFGAANTSATGLARTTTGLIGSFRSFGTQMDLQQRYAERAAYSMGRVGAAVSVLQANIPRLQSTIPTVSAMNSAFLDTRSAAGAAATSLTGVGQAATVGLKGAWSGLVSFMGGPMGLAVAGLSIGLGLLANWHQKASQAAADQRRSQQNLSSALKETSGAVNTDVRATAAKLLQDMKVLSGQEKLVDVMARAKVGLPELTNAYLGLNGGLKQLSDTMNEQAEAELRSYRGKPTEDMKKRAGDAERAADAIKELLKVQESEAAKTKEIANAVGDVERSGVAYEKLKGLVGQYSNATLDATARTDALKAALDVLAGGTLSLKDAQARADGAILSALQSAKSAADERNAALKEGTAYTKGWGAAILEAGGGLKTTTENGHQLYDTMVSIRDATLDSTKAAYDLAISQKKSVPEALAAAKTEMGRLYESAIQMAMGYGLTREQAEKAAAAMGLVPDKVTTLMAATGADSVIGQLAAVQAEYAKVPGAKSITVQAMTAEAQQVLQGLGYFITTLPDGKIKITTNSTVANAELQSVMNALATMPPGQKIDVDVPTLKAMGELQTIQDELASTPGGKTITVTAPSDRVIQELQRVGAHVESLPNHEVKITAPTNEVDGSTSWIQRAINAIHGRSVNVDVQYRYFGKQRQEDYADGGIRGPISRFANGGVWGRRIKAFAAGTERHVAQIARAGAMRLWAEPETGGEAYIPLSPKKRARSESILEKVAGMFGGHVVYGAANAIASGADSISAADIYRATRSASTARSSAAAGPTSLVGGNLTISTQATNTRDSLQEALFELQRIRLGGI